MMLHAMIMAGGGGTRFWPRSREARPKQFLALGGDRTLLQMALDRVEAQVPPERSWVVTAAAYGAETGRQLPGLPPDHIVGEPFRRDTAAAVALGAALIAREDPSATILVMPADHVIEPAQEFRRAAHVAEQMAAEHANALITFGISPTYPAVGYGYIHRAGELASRQGVSVYRVRGFKEKPHETLAEEYVASGEYFWNAGIFVWRAATILDALRQLKPAMHAAVERIADAWRTPRRDEVLRREFDPIERTSIDFAVMEHAAEAGKEVLAVQATYRWDDVGSWSALERMNPQDADGNTVLGTHAGLHTRDCLIVGEEGRLIATIGVDNLLIVQDGNATLVADKREEAAVKQLVDLLKKKGLETHL
jgi:mannose-1-phosphate guanylyltransferase